MFLNCYLICEQLIIETDQCLIFTAVFTSHGRNNSERGWQQQFDWCADRMFVDCGQWTWKCKRRKKRLEKYCLYWNLWRFLKKLLVCALMMFRKFWKFLIPSFNFHFYSVSEIKRNQREINVQIILLSYYFPSLLTS